MVKTALEQLNEQFTDGSFVCSLLADEMAVYQFENVSNKTVSINFPHEERWLHFIFGLSGETKLHSDISEEEAVLTSENYYLFSNPYQKARLSFDVLPTSEVLVLVIGMKELHEIFGSSFGRDAVATKEFIDSYKMQRFFIEKKLTPSISVIAHQFFSGVNRENILKIYQQGKIMEFLSLYMDTPNSIEETESHCPFVIDSIEMKKIREARDIIIEQMIDPPSLKELSRMVGTNEFKLKVGFKSVFHNTVYGYLAEHRMEQARKLLMVNNARIKEVAAQVGYANPSHFIAAYKRRFGITPKQHVKSLAN